MLPEIPLETMFHVIKTNAICCHKRNPTNNAQCLILSENSIQTNHNAIT